MLKLNQKSKRRFFRGLAICIGVGISAPSAGSAIGMDFATSAVFGGLMVGISLVSTLLITFAIKDGVTDDAFDAAIKEAAEKVQQTTKK